MKVKIFNKTTQFILVMWLLIILLSAPFYVVQIGNTAEFTYHTDQWYLAKHELGMQPVYNLITLSIIAFVLAVFFGVTSEYEKQVKKNESK